MIEGTRSGSASGTKLGRSELLFELSSGGMGTVYLARQRGVAQFERLVVVKRVHAQYAKDAEFRAMLLEEGRLSSYVRHPNAVGALEVGEAGDELFLVFEYVEAVSLSSLVAAAAARSERLAPGVVSRIMSDVLSGLDAAHEAQDVRGAPLDIIHRDVSPQNVIVGTDGSSRLIDFGVAKATAHIGTTRDGVLKGKLRYMSPEQLLRKGIDRRSDLFACATVLTEALIGSKLFDADDEAGVAMSIILGSEDRLQEIRELLPPAVVPVLGRALTTVREERFATAAEFQEALEAAIPPQRPREVAAAVQRYAGTRIEKQRARIRETAEALDKGATTIVENVSSARSAVHAPVTWRRGAALAAIVATLAAGAFVVERARTRTRLPTADTSRAASAPPSVVASASSEPPAIASTEVDAGLAAATGHVRPAKPLRGPKPTPSHPLHKSPYDTP